MMCKDWTYIVWFQHMRPCPSCKVFHRKCMSKISWYGKSNFSPMCYFILE